MELKSYAILLPCGVGLFAGVEFVCCPVDKTTATQHVIPGKNTFSHDLGVFSNQNRDDLGGLDDDDDDEDDDDQDDDEYDEDDYDDDYLDEKKDGVGKFGEGECFVNYNLVVIKNV